VTLGAKQQMKSALLSGGVAFEGRAYRRVKELRARWRWISGEQSADEARAEGACRSPGQGPDAVP